ncbi:MAG: hypothetical protein IIX07_02625 [Lachnospiraceae bacterium]|nr:hypothetical protein [Lachnospiraceae bacterium]
MKKHVSGFLFFFCLTMFCLIGLFWLTDGEEKEEVQQVQAIEMYEPPLFAERKGVQESEMEEPSVHLVLNMEEVRNELVKESYYLVAEEGYLIVYDSEKESVSLFTHMPLTEFPIKEQERLMEGIWFSTMAEIFSYLESYSS